ncbi:hypothetical protein HXX76_002685 [Chlamydomonas incerta]|uniref:Uncharacterized protein n=1 Tax=Chlamydomonas incerta TaxID=51695 RepID=A0A835W7S2_CHLIN|nr:hypothetical protein HXX76_002685 [Chlamydomonas incerta]|eukprot:KAG2442600.1 hypothetical protein HXX76_002685 [Chlamydomonas incerta]
MSQSIDGHPLAGIERSSHLEEYSRTRPASAGSRPRSLLNKVSNAAAAVQVDDDPDPVDAEPWVLEGWGDGPSVSEAAQQAALKLAPHLKNVPTTLVGLGGGPGGGRRVLSAGPGGRSNQLKASEARRKPPSGSSPQPQGDRRASGSQNPAPAGVASGGPHPTATVRRAALPPPRNLEVGDESDGEPYVPTSGAATGRAAGSASTIAQGRPVVGAGPKPTGPASGSVRQIQSSVAAQIVQNTPGVAAKLVGRRDAAGALVPQPPGLSAAAGPGSAAAAAAAAAASGNGSPMSPRYRSLSAEAHHHPSPMGPGSAASSSVGSSVAPGRATVLGAATATRGSPGPGSNHGHPPLPPHGHLEPLSPLQGKYGGRGDPGPTSGGLPIAGGGGGIKMPRSSSFTSPGKPPTAGAGGVAASEHDDLAANLAPIAPPPPQLPGLFLTGRKGTSFRNDGLGLSGWDPEAPAFQHPGSPSGAGGSSGGGGAGQNVSLWIGPTAPGAGTSGLQVGSPAGSGRGSPAGGPGARRDQLTGNSRLHRGATTGPAAPPPASAPLAPIDLGLAPERSSGGGAGPRARMPATGRSPSPDVTAGFGFPVPHQDSLSDFAASRQDISSAGSNGGAPGGEPPKQAPSRTGTYTGLLPPASTPMRVTSLGAKSSPVPRQ